MKLIRHICVGILGITLMTACNIDRLPYDSVESEKAESDPNFLKNAITGVYGYMKGTLSNSWINETHRLMEYNSDNVSLSGTTGDPLFYMYNYHHIDNGWRINDFWERSYKTIYGANSIIEKGKTGESKETDSYIGEAYFLRGMIYLYLSNVFGKPYTHGTDNLSVPLKLDTDRSNIPPRATVGAVYEQIVKDFIKAAELINEDKPSYYANKDAAYAMLSRVYLYMDNNAKAIEYANKILIDNSSKYKLLNESQFRKMNTLTPEANPEAIFSIKYMTDMDEGSQDDVVGGFYSTIDGVGWGEMYASRSYIDDTYYFPNDARQAFIDPQYANTDPTTGQLYEGIWVGTKLSNDKTNPVDIPIYKTGFFTEQGGSSRLEVKEGNKASGKVLRTITLHTRQTPTGVQEYYFNEGAQDTIVHVSKLTQKRGEYPLYFVTKCSQQDGKIHSWSPSIIRLAEVYLNKAEALAKQGGASTAEAIALLNELRANRGVPPYTGDLISGRQQDNLLDVILAERRIELAFEGHRAFDIFRNKKILNRNYPGTHLLNNTSYKEIKWSDKNIIYLLPIAQINAQGNLVQNEI